MEAPDIILKITMANAPTSSRKVCSAETPNNHTRDGRANAPQTLTQTASAESCCGPQNLYLSMEFSFENCSI